MDQPDDHGMSTYMEKLGKPIEVFVLTCWPRCLWDRSKYRLNNVARHEVRSRKPITPPFDRQNVIATSTRTDDSARPKENMCEFVEQGKRLRSRRLISKHHDWQRKYG